jgi:hypothetical protein
MSLELLEKSANVSLLLCQIEALGEMLNTITGHKLDITNGALCIVGGIIMNLAQEAQEAMSEFSRIKAA